MMEGHHEDHLNSTCCSLLSVMLVNETIKASAGDQQVAVFWYRYSFYVSGALIAAYGLVFVAGLVGNSLVVLTVLRGNRMMRRSVTNIFLVNLAIADLLVVLACIPFTLVAHLIYPWVLGWIICKLVPYLQGVSVCASVWTLVAVAVERYRSISSPWKRRLSSKRYRSVIALIWILSFVITIPWLFVFNQFTIDGVLVCTESWPDPIMDDVYFGVVHLTLCYILPLTIIALCYAMICKRIWCRKIPGESHHHEHSIHRPSAGVLNDPSSAAALPGLKVASTRQSNLPMLHRARLRALRMLAVVVVGFAVAWLPLYVTFARLKFFAESISEEEAQIWEIVIPIAQWMGSANSCVNPVLYHFLDPRFRAGFRQILICFPTAASSAAAVGTNGGARWLQPTAAGGLPTSQARYRLPVVINFSQRGNTNHRKSSPVHEQAQEMNVLDGPSGISNQTTRRHHQHQDGDPPDAGITSVPTRHSREQHNAGEWI